MPLRGGRAGGSSRGGRISVRAPRASSSGSRGFRTPLSRSTPAAASTPGINSNPSTSNPVHHRPWMRPGMFRPSGTVWKIIALILALFLFGACGCVGLGLLLQALGYGS